jgi:hypothetical protein
MGSVPRGAWAAHALTSWVVGVTALACGGAVVAWLVTGLTGTFAMRGGLLFGIALVFILGVLLGVALGAAFVAVAWLLPGAEVLVGTVVGASAGLLGWFGEWYVPVALAMVGGAYGAVVGRRVAGLRSS